MRAEALDRHGGAPSPRQAAAPLPLQTAWEGGTYKVVMQFTEEYPNKAPVVKFRSTMFHPNSASVGEEEGGREGEEGAVD